MPSSGGAGQPRVWLRTIENQQGKTQEHTWGRNPAETENTVNAKPRNTNRGIRSRGRKEQRREDRTNKRRIARQTHRDNKAALGRTKGRNQTDYSATAQQPLKKTSKLGTLIKVRLKLPTNFGQP